MNIKDYNIIVTGGFGFIGSNFVKFLNDKGIIPYIIEKFEIENDTRWNNIKDLNFILLDPKDDLPYPFITVSLGASVDTTEKFSKNLWDNNVFFNIKLQKESHKFIYASSASVYGNSFDFTERLDGLVPCSPYAVSKLCLDRYFFKCNNFENVYGLRLFNCYGPRERHKERMASVIYKALTKQHPIYKKRGTDDVENAQFLYESYPKQYFEEVNREGWKLFKSDKKISRDFIFSEDVCRVFWHFITKEDIPAGVFNVGSGTDRTFEDIVKTVDSTLPIVYMEIPEDLKKQYQYFTKANLIKLRTVAGYTEPFTALEDGIEQTRQYLIDNPI